MNKKRIVLTFASAIALALVGCNKGGKPYDPDADPSGGGQIKKKDFAYALNYDYQSFTIAYAQAYDEGESVETAYEYHEGGKYGVTVVNDVTYSQSIGQMDYSFYASTSEDDYAYWEKSSGYEYDGWIANGYRDADLAMYHAYFDFYYLLENLTIDDVEELGGIFFIKESSLSKINDTAFQFFGNPLFGGEDLTSIAFLLDDETGLIKKIAGSVSELSDDGVEIQLSGINAKAYPTGVTVPEKPYRNSDTDRNIYTYQEMLGDDYVPDVWPTSVSLTINGTVKTETGFDAVIDLDESIDISYALEPETTNRKEYDWVVSNSDVVDLDYEYNYTAQHKYLTGVGEGTCEVSIKFKTADGTYVESNKLKIKVNGVPQIDKTDAVYDLTVTGGSYRDADKEFTNVIMNNAATKVEGAPYTVEGHNIHLLEAEYTECFGETGMVLFASPSSQDYMNSDVGFNSYLLFDFGDQEVTSLDFYYALQRGNQKGAAVDALSEAYISTSLDGTTWSDPIDMKAEMKANFERINLDYDLNLKVMSRTFTKARQVKLFFKANIVGKNFNICMNSFVFKADATCHNHEVVGPTVDVTSVVITSSATSVKVGKTLTFSISSILPSDATDKSVTWHTSDSSKATIDENGVLTGVDAGEVKVYALSSNNVKSNEITVTVIGQEYLDNKWVGYKYLADDVYENLVSYSLSFEILTTSTAKFTIKPASGDATVINLTYDTYDNDHTCPYRFEGTNGEVLNAKLSAYDDSTCEVFLRGSVIDLGNSHTNIGEELTKYVAATSIVAKNNGAALPSSFEMLEGQDMSVVTVVSPTSAYYKVATAESDNPSVVGVENETIGSEPINNSFVLTAYSAGQAVITFSNGEVSAQYTITVNESITVSSLTLTASKSQIEVDQDLQFSTTINPTNVNNYNLVYSVDKTNLATINASTGLLHAKAAGDVVVTVTDTVSGADSTFNLKIVASTSPVPSGFVGTWEGYDIIGSDFTFVINNDGTAVLSSDYLNDDITFTVDADRSSQSTVYFVADDDSGLEICIYGSSTSSKNIEVSEDEVGELYFYGQPTEVTKA